jgi:WD40 repeat protein
MSGLRNSTADADHSIRALMGRISNSNSSAVSYLITGGTDKQIRYWDFSSPGKCFTMSGLAPAQPKPLYEAAPTAIDSTVGNNG